MKNEENQLTDDSSSLFIRRLRKERYCNAFAESSKCCIECDSTEIIQERNYAFRWGWQIIRENGTDKKVQKIPGIYLRLSMKGDEQQKGSMQYEDLPRSCCKRAYEKSDAINKILQESDILKKITELGANLNYHITVYDSK